jgi:hypothetical protein
MTRLVNFIGVRQQCDAFMVDKGSNRDQSGVDYFATVLQDACLSARVTNTHLIPTTTGNNSPPHQS